MRTRVLALAGLLGACGGGGGGGPDADTGDGGIGCVGDPRAETYTANMERAGTAGLYTFVLESSDPGPPVRGNNTWSVQVLDAGQAPVSGATVKAVPYMPDHGHGTAVVPSVTAGASDDYDIAPLYLFMPGLWQVTISATAGDVSDSAKYSFCIQG